jgi:hypothetical protein
MDMAVVMAAVMDGAIAADTGIITAGAVATTTMVDGIIALAGEARRGSESDGLTPLRNPSPSQFANGN